MGVLALALLAPVKAGFTEGVDSADLQEWKALLEELPQYKPGHRRLCWLMRFQSSSIGVCILKNTTRCSTNAIF